MHDRGIVSKGQRANIARATAIAIDHDRGEKQRAALSKARAQTTKIGEERREPTAFVVAENCSIGMLDGVRQFRAGPRLDAIEDASALRELMDFSEIALIPMYDVRPEVLEPQYGGKDGRSSLLAEMLHGAA